MMKSRVSKVSGRQRKKRMYIFLIIFISGIVALGLILLAGEIINRKDEYHPEQILLAYMDCITEKRYEEMYGMLTKASVKTISEEDFVKRNSAIYEGMEMKNMLVKITDYDKGNLKVKYDTSFDTAAGNVSFENEADFLEEDGGYKLVWSDSMILPGLGSLDKVRVSTVQAERGEILDRNGRMLAGKGTASSVGNIPGVMISDTEIREYPLQEAAAHLVGYVQNVTAEDLEKHTGEGYTASSVIGKTGLEGLFEEELKGKNGCRIYIADSEGKEKEELVSTPVQHGKDIRLTIDADLQSWLYESFKTDKSCSVSLNPFTGEVLALVSTPSYDSNAFVRGMSGKQWKILNEDDQKPLYNRFRQVWCPGSTFKPITAAIGLQSGAIRPTEQFKNEGLRWQKDKSWGTYYITTLHTYKPVTLENALIYSDNIYFAKVALKTGAEEMENALTGIGFHEEMPFEIKMAESSFSNTEHIESEIQLADSGYGQGQMLVNPLHMACIYTSFCNNGDMIKPYLLYKDEDKTEYWISGGFSKKASKQVLDGIKKVVNDPHGTGYAIHRKDVVLAGKTGTAEIKESKEDTSGTELGWFSVLTPDRNEKKPILIVSMVEDVKERGGSGYVIGKDKQVLEKWFAEQAAATDVAADAAPDLDLDKGYDLTVPAQEKDEAERDSCQLMTQFADSFKNADKGNSSNVVLDRNTVKQMSMKIGKQGYPVAGSEEYSNMVNYKVVEEFLKNAESGDSGSVVVYRLNPDGGLGREKYIYDGKNMFLLESNFVWGEDNKPDMTFISYTRLKKWRYSDKGWFCYELCVPEYPEVTEMVDGSCLIRVRPMSRKKRRLSKQCVRKLGYQGNNLLCSDWDENHLEKLDYNGLYEYLYEMKYKKKFDCEKFPKGIPKDQFESLIMEYLPVSAGMIRKYAIFDKKEKTYAWSRLGCFNYTPTYFGTSVPEVTKIKKNPDGTVTLTVDAVCEMILCDEAVITHELTVVFAEDGSFRYLGNKILNGGIKDIPKYQYRLDQES